MRSPPIVELEVLSDLLFGFARGIVSVQVNVFVFHRFPETLYKHVTPPGSLTIRDSRRIVRLARFDPNSHPGPEHYPNRINLQKY